MSAPLPWRITANQNKCGLKLNVLLMAQSFAIFVQLTPFVNYLYSKFYCDFLWLAKTDSGKVRRKSAHAEIG